MADSGGGLRVAVLGAGAVGLASAAVLRSRGHVPVLWSPRGGCADTLEASGALTSGGAVATAGMLAAAVEGADAVLVAVPATAYRGVLDGLAALGGGAPVIVSGHLSFAGLYLARQGWAGPVVAWGTTVVSGRRLGPGVVAVSSVRAEVDMAVLPGEQGAAMLTLCQALFGERFRARFGTGPGARAGLLTVGLSNVNPQNHLAIALCNFTRIEHGEAWAQNANITLKVGRLMEALDAERLAVAAAFGVEVRTLRRHFSVSFHTPEAPLHEMAAALAQREAARGETPGAPRTTATRYVLEDAPYGLHPTLVLAGIAGVAAPLHAGGLTTLSAMYGRDLAADNDILPGVGLAAMGVEGLRALG